MDADYAAARALVKHSRHPGSSKAQAEYITAAAAVVHV